MLCKQNAVVCKSLPCSIRSHYVTYAHKVWNHSTQPNIQLSIHSALYRRSCGLFLLTAGARLNHSQSHQRIQCITMPQTRSQSLEAFHTAQHTPLHTQCVHKRSAAAYSAQSSGGGVSKSLWNASILHQGPALMCGHTPTQLVDKPPYVGPQL